MHTLVGEQTRQDRERLNLCSTFALSLKRVSLTELAFVRYRPLRPFAHSPPAVGVVTRTASVALLRPVELSSTKLG